MIPEKVLKTDCLAPAIPTNIDTTVWGRVPTVQAVVNAFDNDPESRLYQDVGLDGLRNRMNRHSFQITFRKLQLITTPDVYQEILKDPSSDDFHYFRGSDYDSEQIGILERYKKYNGLDGNSPTSEMSMNHIRPPDPHCLTWKISTATIL